MACCYTSVKQLIRIRPYMAYTASSHCLSHHLAHPNKPSLFITQSLASARVRTLHTTAWSPISTTTTNWKSGHGHGRGLSSSRTGATTPHQVNDPGSIDSSLILSMQTKIKDELNAESVTVKDAYGDGRHVTIDVVSSAFEGQSAVNRQRMVYKAIWEELQSTVHAVDQMFTRTPSEAAGGK